MLKGNSWKDFQDFVKSFNGQILNWDSIVFENVITNAIANRISLPFQNHFRDYIIGTQCVNQNLHLITNNTNHFSWMKEVAVDTPERFYQQFQEKNLED